MDCVFIVAAFVALGIVGPEGDAKSVTGLPAEVERQMYGVFSVKPPEWTIPAYSLDVLNIVFSKKQGLFITVGHDRVAGGNLKVWNFATKKHVQTLEAGGTFTETFVESKAAFLTVSGKVDGWLLREWDIEMNAARTVYTSSNRGERAIEIWPQRNIVVVRGTISRHPEGENVLKFVDYAKGHESIFGQKAPFTVMGFSRDQKLAALRFENGWIRVFDWANKKKLSEFQVADKKDEVEQIQHCHFCCDNVSFYALISGFRPRIEKWDMVQGKKLESLRLAVGPRRTSAISPDDRVLVISQGKLTLFVDLKTGSPLVLLCQLRSEPNVFTPKGVASRSPGLPRSGYPGERRSTRLATPKGLYRILARGRWNPFGVPVEWPLFARVARCAGNPGL